MKTLLMILTVGLVWLAFHTASAQTAQRMQFAKGKSSAVVKGTTGSYGMTYVLRAKSGQKLLLTLTPTSKVGIKVETDSTHGHMVLLREERGAVRNRLRRKRRLHDFYRFGEWHIRALYFNRENYQAG